MYKLTRPHCIPIIFIYFTFIYSQLHHSTGRQALASDTNLQQQQATIRTTKSDPLQPDSSSELAKTKLRQDAMKKLLHLQKMPGDAITTANTKFHVPRAMLEKYLESRENVRDFIPDDRDFLGKLDLQGIEESHEKFWNEIYQRSGSYELEVDMSPPKKGGRKEDAKHLVVIRLEEDPEDVPANVEPLLPPHVTSVRNQKQYISVYLRFKLSQELKDMLTNGEELSYADLYLARDGLNGCLFQRCERKPILLFKQTNQTSTANKSESLSQASDARASNVVTIIPEYQRVFVLLVTGYDNFNDPITTIIANERISTRQTNPIQFDIGTQLKNWVKDPKTNHGLIVRVVNDDEKFEEQRALSRKSTSRGKSGNIKREAISTSSEAEDDESEMVVPEASFLEQVRLKRGFGQASDDDDTWQQKQPYIVAYTKPLEQEQEHEFERRVERHGKRHVDPEEANDDTEGMQADDPNVAGDQQTGTSTASSYIQTTVNGRNMAIQTDKSISLNPQTSTFESVTRRDHIVNSSRRGQQTSRPPGRASSLQQGGSSQRARSKGKPPLRQPDKCSKKTLKINFDEVGWSSWIIAPHSYFANYCSGECTWPLSDTQNATNHAIIQAIYHSVGRVVPKVCCAPVKLARMAILYQVDGIVQMRQYDDMIIDACGCL